MKALSNYLEFRKDVKNIFFLLEDDASIDLLTNLCSRHKIHNLCIAGRNKRQLYSIKQRLVEDSVLRYYSLPQIEIYVYSKEISCDEITMSYDTVIFDPKVSMQAIL